MPNKAMHSLQSVLAVRVATKWKYTVLGCLLCSAVRAEDIVLLPPLRVGESITLEMTMTRERNAPGKPAIKSSSTTPVRVEVLEVADNRTVVGWTLGKPRIDGPVPNAETTKALDPLVELVTGQTIELVFDEEFTARSIRNLDEIIQLSNKTLDLLQPTLPKDAAAVLVPRMREMFSDPNTVQNLMLQRPGRYFLVYGWELEPGKPREEEISLPTPFGGDPLPATLAIELKPFAPADTQYVVHYNQELDQEAVQHVIRAAMEKLAGNKFSPNQPLPSFDIEDRGEFKFSRATGWIEYAIVKRTTTSDAGSQVDSFEFRSAK